jgi:CHAD domain-containing protein
MDPTPATPPSTFRLDPLGDVRDEAARVFTEELALALAELRDQALTDDLAVHSVRKRLKRLRALLRLFRYEIGSGFGASNRALRDAGRELSDLRDARVALDTLDRLSERYPDHLPAGTKGPLRAIRRSLAESMENSDAADLRASVASKLVPALEWPKGWQFSETGFPAMERGLQRTYRQGRTALAEARATGSVAAFHEWRKRVKDHWHHTQLIGQPGHRGMRTRELRLHDLSDALGDIQDLRVLEESLSNRKIPAGRALPKVLGMERRRLDEIAGRLGAALYRYRPVTVAARYARAWEKTTAPGA